MNRLTQKNITKFRGIPLNRVYTVDPGDNCALSYWDGYKTPRTYFYKGNFYEIIAILNSLFKRQRADYCILEGIDFRGGKTAKYLPELGYLVGGIAATAARYNIYPYVIQAHTWKGSMNDAQVINRVKRINNLIYTTPRGSVNSHITDSVGMGYYLTGEFTNENKNQIDWKR